MRSRIGGSGLLVLLTCLVATVSYVGAVTTGALLAFVGPSSLVLGLVGWRLRGKTAQGLVLVLVTAFVVAEVVNLVSGELQGPAARGSVLAGTGTGLALVLSGSALPALFLLPLAGVVAGAMSLGAGGQVQLVAVVTAGLALLALAAVERERRRFVAPQRARGSVLLMLLLVVVAGVFTALFQGRFEGLEAKAPLRTTINESVRVPGVLSLPNRSPDREPSGLPVVGQPSPSTTPPPTTPPPTSRPTLSPTTRPSTTPTVRPTSPTVRPTVTPTQRPTTTPRPTVSPTTDPAAVTSPPVDPDDDVSSLWWLLLLLPVLLVLGVLARLALASLSWRRHYRRIVRSGAGHGAVWVWTVAHLSRVGLAPALQSSPDILAAGRLDDIRPELREPVQQLAATVSPCVYGPLPAAAADLSEVWKAARGLSDQAWKAAGFARRWAARWRMAPPRRGALGR